MNKTLITISAAILVIAIGSSSIKAPKRSYYQDGNSVTGYSSGCTGCHGTGSTGTVVLAGIPDTVIAGQMYSVSLTIADAAQKRWGFDMAVGSGTFTLGAGSNVLLTGTKNAHHGTSAPVAPSPYTFDSLYWTAPTAIPAGGKIKFAYAVNAANDNNATSGDHCYKGTLTIVEVASTLPVKLESFEASVSGGKVRISWLTASELNTDHFEVERSVDGKDFVLAGKVEAAGNSTSARNYSFTEDETSLSGTVYYRLKSVDKNGGFTYSNVASVAIQSANRFITNLYPNPLRAGQDIKLTYLSEKSENVNFQLINLVGKRMSTTNIPVSEGSNTLSLPTGHLTPGVYYLAVSINSGIVQKVPVVVQ